MASSIKNLSNYELESIPDAGSLKLGIVVSDWNNDITHKLYSNCVKTLMKHGIKEENITCIQVPGSFELPSGCKLMLAKVSVDAIICLGCIIKGETNHDVFISQAVASGITSLSISSGVPCIFGVLTTNTLEQAKERAGGKHGCKGIEVAVSALRMADLKKKNFTKKKNIGFQ